MIKKNLHPITYKTKVFSNQVLILILETTKKELNVDIWAGNHPFYTNNLHIIDTEGRIKKFNKKYNLNNKI